MHQFFQQFGNMQQPQASQNMTPELQNNLSVLEIYNNWEFVKELFFKMMSGELSEVDQSETGWISYINSNNIDLRNYKDEEEFLQKHLRELAPEKIKE